MSKSDPRPRSETNTAVNLLGTLAAIGAVAVLHTTRPDLSAMWLAGFGMLAAIVPPIAYDFLVAGVRRHASYPLKQGHYEPDRGRSFTKLVGLIATFALLALCYWSFPQYQRLGRGELLAFGPFFRLMRIALPVFLLFSWHYIYETDARMEQPRDGCWHMGRLVLGGWADVDPRFIAEHARCWLIKGFFFPIMFIAITHKVAEMSGGSYARLWAEGRFIDWYRMLFTGAYAIDVVFAATGYVMTYKLLGSHIRSAEPTMLGWCVALMCYPPFYDVLFAPQYLAYTDGFFWNSWLDGHPRWLVIWGGTILLLMAIYTLATVALGIRFSNLTYRGLVTGGPYRFSKHPAYISKNLAWWMIHVPFLAAAATPWTVTVRQCLLLLLVNWIYFLRARTEENHLSNYPEYVEYAEWIERNGIFRWIGRRVPWLRYSAERAARAGSTAWWVPVRADAEQQ